MLTMITGVRSLFGAAWPHLSALSSTLLLHDGELHVPYTRRSVFFSPLEIYIREKVLIEKPSPDRIQFNSFASHAAVIDDLRDRQILI